MSCDIRVNIHYNCSDELDRIYDLVQRSNQLNFTKIRSTKEELSALFSDETINTGYVSAKDKFGDYGIIGFFAVSQNTLIHYVFSCRTLGMSIEQYVYKSLNCPILNVVEPVVVQLNDTFNPTWINQTEISNTSAQKHQVDSSILMKGPCDMEQIFSFIQSTDKISTEFTYVGKNGVSVEGHNHTSQIATSLKIDDARKTEILSDLSWFDPNMFDTKLRYEKFDYVILSMFSDGNLGLYKRRSTGEYVAMCEGFYDLTNPDNHQKYIDKEIFASGIDFTKEDLTTFGEKYEYIKNDDFCITIKSLDEIYEYLDKNTQLILILPSQRPFLKDIRPSYADRHKQHIILNDLVKEWKKEKENVTLIEIDKYIKSDSDFTDSINHFVKKVYFDLASDLLSIVDSQNALRSKSRIFLLYSAIRQKLSFMKQNVLNALNKNNR